MRPYSRRAASAVAATAATAACLAANAQFMDDCNANGVADAIELAQGLVTDCDGNGIPDTCDHAGQLRTLQGNWGDALVFYLTVPEPVASSVRVDIRGAGSFGAGVSYLSIYVGEEFVANVWEYDGVTCDPKQAGVQEATIFIPAHVVNNASRAGNVRLRIVPIGVATGNSGCNEGLVQVQYLRDIAGDCNANGILDACDIANDPSIDCNGNGSIDACEVAANTGYFNYDCDRDGQHDACQIVADPTLDANADGVLDAYQISLGDFTRDRLVDGADLAYVLESWGPSKGGAADLNGDGMVDAFELARVLGNWGRYPTGWGVVLEAAPNPRVVMHDGFREGIEATGLPWRVRDNASGIEMLLVPPGTFMMGCSPLQGSGSCFSDEYPVHQVTLTKPFYLGRFEVTQAQWTQVMGSNPSSYRFPNAVVPERQVPERPVERVSWDMIQGFEAETDLRLPTEAEWEYACRAGTTTAFNNGSNDAWTLGTIAWYLDLEIDGDTRPVGQKLANSIGLHDMHGNVLEWCEDRYSEFYYSESPEVDPPGPIGGGGRIMRGGHFYDQPVYCRASGHRYRFLSATLDHNFGFRVARTPY